MHMQNSAYSREFKHPHVDRINRRMFHIFRPTESLRTDIICVISDVHVLPARTLSHKHHAVNGLEIGIDSFGFPLRLPLKRVRRAESRDLKMRK